MFYLFIFESIGTSELMLIGLVALIVFGPRKLPELARTLGRTMNEFRRSTDDFKRTWQQEIDLEDAKKDLASLTDLQTGNSIKSEDAAGKSLPTTEEINQPEIKQIDKGTFDRYFEKPESDKSETAEPVKRTGEKQEWL